ncbi:MAG: RtcB family protein [Bacteroidales bacterium]|nr:RtcB family protein [Bacteroidales bacterium]
MKKLKLRAREITKLGFTGSEMVSFIIHHVHPHFITAEKQKVLQILKELLNEPEMFREDPVFGRISEKIKFPGKQKEAEKIYDTGRLQCAPPTKSRVATIKKLEKPAQEFTIYGRDLIEREALEQMETAMQLPVTLQGALMADAHSGYGLPIGGVLATQNAIIPYGVGMDIGCRMCLSIYDLPPAFIENNRQKLKKILLDHTRFGKDEFPGKKEHEIFDRKEFGEIPFLRDMKDKACHQLGTSGHGNHFVDIGIVKILSGSSETGLHEGEYFGILSHSGSRNFGASIAHHYTRIAKDKCRLPKGAVNLAWLDLNTEEGHEYWMAMNLAGDYSAANHQVIHRKLAAAISDKPAATIENHHNFAWKEHLADGTEAIIHRKGATPALIGSCGVIPGSMTTPAFIVKGKGNPESLNSASHGAGRMMSRSEAKRRFTDKTLEQMLCKAGVELIGGGADEAPGAYKDILKIMEYQKDLVEIMGTFEPKIVRMSKD